MARKASTSAIDSGRCAAACSASASPPSEKLTINAPPPLSRSRRDGLKCFVMAASSRLTGGALDGAHDAGMGTAAADIVGERVADIRLGRILVAGEERDRLHDHAIDAIAALHGLLLDKGALHRVQPVALGEALDGHDL